MRQTIGTAFAVMSLASNAWAADCALPADMAALKTAALQQELMVAALSCRDIARYNDFVLSHRSMLQESDARLKSYFLKTREGERGYHFFKTELANDASLRSTRDGESFCADADGAFSRMDEGGSIAAVLDTQSWGVEGRSCGTVLADASPVPVPRRISAEPQRHRALDGAFR
jgi:hypothetical protein